MSDVELGPVHILDGTQVIMRWDPDTNYKSWGTMQGGGWYYYGKNYSGVVFLYTRQGEPYPTQKTAQRAFESFNRTIYWRSQFEKALINMPHRLGKAKTWCSHDRGTVPLPEYVEKHARGTMKMERGQVYELKPVEYGQPALARKILGYSSGNAFYTARMEGQEPRDPERKRLLLALAGPEGNAMAWEWLHRHHKAYLYQSPKKDD